MAERVGFEPTGLAPGGFQDRSVRPLRHLSAASHALVTKSIHVPVGPGGLSSGPSVGLRTAPVEPVVRQRRGHARGDSDPSGILERTTDRIELGPLKTCQLAISIGWVVRFALGGCLILGAAETTIGVVDGYTPVRHGNTVVYRVEDSR